MDIVIPMLLTPAIIFFAAVLGFAQYRGWTTAVTVIAILLSLPIVIMGPIIASNFYSSYSSAQRQQLRGQFQDPGLTEMGQAIRNADDRKLKALVTAHPKIDWSARDRVGFTLLGVAVWEAERPMPDNPERPLCLRVLVEAGAPYQDDATGPNIHMLPKLVTTVDERPWQVEILALLLRAGANPNEKDTRGMPALIGEFMEVSKAKALLDAGAELRTLRRNDAEHKGWDALMYAAMRARWDLTMLYLERGCDPNYQAPDGSSALSLAKGVSDETLKYNGDGAQRDAFLRALAAAKAASVVPEKKN